MSRSELEARLRHLDQDIAIPEDQWTSPQEYREWQTVMLAQRKDIQEALDRDRAENNAAMRRLSS